MDGVLIDLLNAKWNTFVKFKFYRQFFTFAFYFLISLISFTLRPGPPSSVQKETSKNKTNFGNASDNYNYSLRIIINLVNSSSKIGNDDDYDVEEWWDNLQEECRLMQLDGTESKIRFTAEIVMTVGAFVYLAAAVREARFLGGRMFFENLVINESLSII